MLLHYQIPVAETTNLSPSLMAPNTAGGLAVVHTLCQQLEQRQIAFCHFKSNQHLREGMLGITDLDVLVERGKSQQLHEALYATGFRRFQAVATQSYPAVEDYLAMDEASGRLIHLHLHYQLITGEPHLKGYRLPWEHILLARRLFDKKHGFYVADPAMEMVLLIVRSAIKLRLRNKLTETMGVRYFGNDRLAEYQWLKERADQPEILALTEQLLGANAVKPMAELLASDQPSLKHLLKLYASIKPVLSIYRSFSPLMARCLRTVRELLWVGGGINKRYIHASMPLRRISANGGLVVALMGCDGSGKSTHMQSLVKCLSWKIDVLPLYFGSGDGSSSLLRWPLKQLARLVKHRATTHEQAQTQPAITGNSDSLLKRLGKPLWALTLSLEKRRKLRKATAARNQGMVVICDRYPQNQNMGYNDGPLLADWLDHTSRWRRTLAAWESRPYRDAESYPPDIVIKLDVSPRIAMKRKPDMSSADCERRIRVVRQLHFHPPARVVTIDATKPLEHVLLEVRRTIWQAF